MFKWKDTIYISLKIFQADIACDDSCVSLSISENKMYKCIK